MFLPSQLVEISQRFQPDVEDLQVLLQEEGLPVRSAECLQELSSRLGSDPRFRRDVAFLVRSILGRAGDEPGSLDVLGVLVVAAAGTRLELETPSGQQLLRELLRFVIQQRRPASAAETARAATAEERRAATTAPIPMALTAGSLATGRLPTRGERSLPTPSVAAPDPVAVPSLLGAEPEPFWQRAHAGLVVAVLAVLVVLVVGAGLVIRRGGSKASTRNAAALGTAATAASPTSSAASEPETALGPERSVVVPPPPRSGHNRRKPSPRVRRAEPAQVSVPVPMVANTPANTVARPEATQNNPKLKQPVSASTIQTARPQQESAASLGADAARQRSTRGPTDVIKVFAHPDAAAAAAADQAPPPAFHPRDPVLIARNKPPAFPGQPELQGTVHTGSAGSMASNLMYSPEPEYPAGAIAAGVAGQVTVRAVVGPGGNVIDAHVVSGPPLLREAALEAVGRWRYRPYEQDGKPVAMATTAILDFQIPPRK